MAASTRQYNLRSAGQGTVELPVELHMSEDSTFVKELLASQQDPTTGQVSDNDSSINESDCEALIASSESDDNDSREHVVKSHKSSRKPDPTMSDSQSTSQQAINVQILAQLQSLGQRLDVMEKNSCKKSTDTTKIKSKTYKPKVKAKPAVTPPPALQETNVHDLHSLRQDANLQIQVERRLQELASLNKTGTKIKSLRGGPVEVLVPNRVKWPHEYVLSGNSKERISYDQLSITQWVAGFGRIMKEEKNSEIKDSMLDYLVSLFDDANDFSWDAAKASHAVLLCRMEQGEIRNYTELEKIDRIRRAHAQRHNQPPPQSYQNANKTGQRNNKSMPCVFYNKGTCNQPKTHETRGILYRHISSACFTNGKAFSHSEIECKNKLKKLSKNE